MQRALDKGGPESLLEAAFVNRLGSLGQGKIGPAPRRKKQ